MSLHHQSWPFLLSFKLSFSTDPFSSYHHHFSASNLFCREIKKNKIHLHIHTLPPPTHSTHSECSSPNFTPTPKSKLWMPMEPVSSSFVWALIFKHIEYALFLETCSPPDNVQEITRFSSFLPYSLSPLEGHTLCLSIRVVFTQSFIPGSLLVRNLSFF